MGSPTASVYSFSLAWSHVSQCLLACKWSSTVVCRHVGISNLAQSFFFYLLQPQREHKLLQQHNGLHSASLQLQETLLSYNSYPKPQASGKLVDQGRKFPFATAHPLPPAVGNTTTLQDLAINSPFRPLLSHCLYTPGYLSHVPIVFPCS
jgi:hypothetical protein